MRVSLWLFATIGVWAALSAPGTGAVPAVRTQASQFRLTVTGVALHVLVRQGGRPVGGLAAEDFTLTDSAVRQEIRALAAATVPMDLSLVIERNSRAERLEGGYRAEIAEIAPLLSEDDRLRVVAFGEDVWDLVPLSPRDGLGQMDDAVPSEGASEYDALASVLMRSPEAGRQHLVISLSWADDTLSIVTAEALLDIARRSRAQLHVLVSEWSTIGTHRLARVPTVMSAFASWNEARQEQVRRISSMPSFERQLDVKWNLQRKVLVDAAEATGGGEIRRGAFSGSISNAVRRVLEDVRSSYILYYQPTGVPERGWHPIEVRVARTGNFDVRARPGYAR